MNSNLENVFTRRVLPNYAIFFLECFKKKNPLGSQVTRM